MGMFPELHVISDGKLDMPALVYSALAIHPYIDAFHIREKSWSARTLCTAVEKLIEGQMPIHKLFINDRVDIAAIYGLGGVQLGGGSLFPQYARKLVTNRTRIGSSVHKAEEAGEAAKQGADYCIMGHIYETKSKEGMPGRGISTLTEICRTTRVPVLAIGGISVERVPEVIRAGASGVAVMSGIMGTDDPVTAAQGYRRALHNSV